MNILAFVRDMFKKFPLLLTMNSVLLILVGLIDAATTLAIVPLIDFVTTPDLQSVSPLTRNALVAMEWVGLTPRLESWVAILLGFMLLSGGTYVAARHVLLRTKYALLYDMMVGTFDDFFRARWYFFSSGNQGAHLNTFLREIYTVGDAFGAMSLFFAEAVQLLFYLAVPLYLSWQITGLSMATALILAIPFLLLGRLSYRLGQRNTATANDLGAVLQESLGAAKVILGFGNQAKASHRLRRTYNAHLDATLKSQTLGVAVQILYRPFGMLALVVALLAARRWGVPLSEIAVLLAAFLRVITLMGSLTSGKNVIQNYIPSYEQVKQLRLRSQRLQQVTGSRIFTGIASEIAFDGATFNYPGEANVLDGLTLRIPRGHMVAVVGESGAGKSTLIDLLMGFNEPTQGRVTIDGIPLAEFDINSYRQRVGYVPQDSILFNMTVRDNLLWAKDGATWEEMLRACQLANADEFISQLPLGYDTVIGDRGVRLSGGQVQRLALARAILRKPDLLILDEATSSLDTHSERLIQQAIDRIAQETTVVVIAHRLSTIINATCIVVLKLGRVVEQGAFSELVQQPGPFRRMAELQGLVDAPLE